MVFDLAGNRGITRYIRSNELIARNTEAARTYYYNLVKNSMQSSSDRKIEVNEMFETKIEIIECCKYIVRCLVNEEYSDLEKRGVLDRVS